MPMTPQATREALEDIRRSTKELASFLMSHEMTLVEQVEDVLKDFERAYADITSNVVEYAQGFFSQMRELENDFNEKFSEFVMNCADRLNKANVDELDDYVRDVRSEHD
jgi:ADP-glucose pyrophosphorylase